MDNQHYGPESYDKNFIFRADNWLLAGRWDMLVRDREQIDLVQVISWNDYGECHYMGPIAGAEPNSTSWTTGFDHQGTRENREQNAFAENFRRLARLAAILYHCVQERSIPSS